MDSPAKIIEKLENVEAGEDLLKYSADVFMSIMTSQVLCHVTQACRHSNLSTTAVLGTVYMGKSTEPNLEVEVQLDTQLTMPQKW